MHPIDAVSFLKAFKPATRCNIWMIGLGLALCVPMSAEAQYYGRGWDGYGPGPYGFYGRGPYGGGPYADYDPEIGPGPRYREPGYGYDESVPPNYRRPSQPSLANQPSQNAIISLELIERKIKAAGFRLIATPRHKGNIYLAEVEDKNAVRRRLVYDAHDGHLLENTSLGPVKKPIPRAEDEKPSKDIKPGQSGKAGEPKLPASEDEAKNLAVPAVNEPAPATTSEPVSIPKSVK